MHGCDVKQKETTSLQNDNHYWAIMSIMGNKHPFLGGDFFSKNEFWALLKAPPLALLWKATKWVLEAVKGYTMFTQCGWRLRKRSGDYIERGRAAERRSFFWKLLVVYELLWKKKKFKLFLSIGGKSPVFPVACGVVHCFISCEGLATTRSGYPTVQVGAKRNRNHHFRCCFDFF